MRVIPFPGGRDGGREIDPDESWLSELEAALNGTGEGSSADSWRALREDVRALAPPMNPEFERRLGERIAARRAHSAPQHSASQRSLSAPQPRRRLGWLPRPSRPALAGLSVACTVIAVVLILAPWRLAGHVVESSPRSPSAAARADRLGPAFDQAENAPVAGASGAKASSKGVEAGASGAAGSAVTTTSAPAASGPASSAGRVQQLGASITLTATPDEVQTVADRVSRLAVSEGGYVRSSHVNEEEKAGEASLTLSLPSAKLNAALASLGRLAPVRAESQSLQDITGTYDAARQRLSDATAERQALLRALAKASTEGQIDSLHERLSQNRGAIAQAGSALQAVSQRASTAEVEVTVLGDAHAGSEGLTLHRGLHDAGRVLVVTLVVLLIAVAVLVPLALAIAAMAVARRAWRRYRRERVLGAEW
ncbi:MAG: DUF4349 domain-containing protein [Solirubrobacteraceae bacterium]|jgi:hypothetical protein